MNLPFNDALKRKSVQEAADTGILLWRENFGYFILFFAIPLWICAFALRIFLPGNYVYFSWLAIWLLKPLFDRIVLHIISIKFFERDASFKRLCRGMIKTIFRGLLGDLLWRRFSLNRSAMMPMRILEKNIKTFKAFNERKKYLLNGGIGYCLILTLWGFAVEIALLFGEAAFYNFINELLLSGRMPLGNSKEAEVFFFAGWCFNMILIETVYVCMGFTLYINSRVAVEGWDLEIAFKNLKKLAAVVIVFACLLLPLNSYADEPPSNEAPLELLQKILESPDFGGEEDTWNLKLRRPAQPGQHRGITLPENLREIVAKSLLIILIGVIAVIAVFLILYLRKYEMKKGGNGKSVLKSQKNDADDPVFLLEKAINYHKQGEIRLAWGYCTAAAIHSWHNFRGIEFPPNATENDCAKIVCSISDNSPKALNFANLIKNWVYLAYAKRLPAEGSFDEAVDLCISLRNEND
ncbi:MAG: hypothetical protein FWC01_05580 [Treponema sp.]|nr:hypothetical protein [Treponema sp.]MCL2237336.1 hypothetical protein [Treponema sp.]